MVALKNYVTYWGGVLINNLLIWLGVSAGLRVTVITTFNAAMSGFIGDWLALVLAPAIWVYRMVREIDSAVPNWIVNIVAWVSDNVKANWNWITGSVNTFINFWNNRNYYIQQALNQVVSGWQTVINWANYVITNAASWIYSHLPSWMTALLSWLTSVKAKVSDLVTLTISEIKKFTDNPVSYILDKLPRSWKETIEFIKGKIEFIRWLAEEAAQTLVLFVSNPAAAVRAWIEGHLLEWVIEQVNQAW